MGPVNNSALATAAATDTGSFCLFLLRQSLVLTKVSQLCPPAYALPRVTLYQVTASPAAAGERKKFWSAIEISEYHLSLRLNLFTDRSLPRQSCSNHAESRFGRNQGFDSAQNVLTVAAVSTASRRPTAEGPAADWQVACVARPLARPRAPGRRCHPPARRGSSMQV
uniref:Uncharacterized protein n=1 Tax=Cryptomonas curvata TaxID=233186 RepID=A0A6T8E642_9CRYP